MLEVTRRAALALVAAATPRRPGLASGIHKLREEQRPLPAAVFLDANGREVGFDTFSGHALVVNFWATWCPPCIAEMPALDRLAALLAPEGVRVLPLSSDRGGRPVVEAFYQRLGVRHLSVWLDPRGAAARAFGVRGLPTTVVVDRVGKERARLEGEAEWDSPELVAAIRRLAVPLM